MNRGLLIGGGVVLGLGALALLASEASASEEPTGSTLPPTPGPNPTVPPKTPGGKTDPRSVEEMAFQVRNHQLYWTWDAAHRACINADINDAEATAATCAAAQNLWSTMMSDLNIPANKTEAVFNQLGQGTL